MKSHTTTTGKSVITSLLLGVGAMFIKKEISISKLMRFFFKNKFSILLVLMAILATYGYLAYKSIYNEMVFTNSNFVKTISLDFKNATSNQLSQALHYCQNKDVYKIDKFACDFLEQKEILKGDK